MMGNYNTYGWNGWMVAVMLAWPVLLGLGIWAVVALTRDRTHTQKVTRETPVEILNRRLAAGEITEEEYARTRHVLNNGGREAASPTAQ